MRTIKLLIANLVNQKHFSILSGNAVDLAENKTYSIAKDTDRLTECEIEILKQICLGYTTEDISAFEKISLRTVETHLTNLLGKTGSQDTAGLLLFASKKE